MGKNKSLNPTDAYRKELRKKELKKNKKVRAVVRENVLQHKDPTKIKDQIQKLTTLEEQGKLDKRMKEKKKQLCDQYTKVVQIRQEKDKAAGITAPASEAPQQVFMNPLESPYYHPTLNPFGAPPPGAPMMRMVPPFGVVPQGFPSQALAEGGVSTTELNTDNAQPPPPGTEDLSDLDIPLPAGPPPDMPLPAGPPPSDEEVPLPPGPPPSATTTLPASPPPIIPVPLAINSGDNTASETPTTLPSVPVVHPPPAAAGLLVPPPPPRAPVPTIPVGLIPPPPPPRQQSSIGNTTTNILPVNPPGVTPQPNISATTALQPPQQQLPPQPQQQPPPLQQPPQQPSLQQQLQQPQQQLPPPLQPQQQLPPQFQPPHPHFQPPPQPHFHPQPLLQPPHMFQPPLHSQLLPLPVPQYPVSAVPTRPSAPVTSFVPTPTKAPAQISAAPQIQKDDSDEPPLFIPPSLRVQRVQAPAVHKVKTSVTKPKLRSTPYSAPTPAVSVRIAPPVATNQGKTEDVDDMFSAFMQDMKDLGAV